MLSVVGVWPGLDLVGLCEIADFLSLTFVDENKARVVQTGKLGSVIFGYLDSEDLLLSYVISVIYNICIENGGFCPFPCSRC